jgi:EpsI family protein
VSARAERSRLLASALVYLASGALLLYWHSVSSPTRRTFDLDAIPTRIGERQLVEEDRLEPEIAQSLRVDGYLLRRYQGPDARPLWLYVAFYRGVGATGAHDPEVCYPAQGWDVQQSRELAIDLGERGSLRARLLRARLELQEETVLYWFQPATRWPRTTALEQLLRIYDALRGTPQYAFVRVSIPGADELGAEALAEFARDVALPVRDVLERGS